MLCPQCKLCLVRLDIRGKRGSSKLYTGRFRESVGEDNSAGGLAVARREPKRWRAHIRSRANQPKPRQDKEGPVPGPKSVPMSRNPAGHQHAPTKQTFCGEQCAWPHSALARCAAARQALPRPLHCPGPVCGQERAITAQQGESTLRTHIPMRVRKIGAGSRKIVASMAGTAAPKESLSSGS